VLDLGLGLGLGHRVRVRVDLFDGFPIQIFANEYNLNITIEK
jgi:hypothetical protein